MRFYTEKLVSAFRKVTEVKRHNLIRCAEASFIPVDIHHLISAVGEITKTFIEVREVDYPGTFVRGIMERYANGTVIIYVKRDQTEDQQNLTTAKELCHVLIDGPEDLSIDGPATIAQMVQVLNHQAGDTPVDGVVASEFIAEMAALEILYPVEHRQADIDSASETVRSLALRYDVPPFVVDRVLMPKYHAVICEIWEWAREASPPPEKPKKKRTTKPRKPQKPS